MIHFSRKQRQLKFLVKKVNQHLETSNNLTSKKISRLKNKIQKLIFELKGSISTLRIKQIVAGVAVILGLSFNTINAQDFAPKILNEFNIGGENESTVFTDFDFVDLDNDGDMDIIGLKYYTYYTQSKFVFQENVGDDQSPEYLEAESMSPLEFPDFEGEQSVGMGVSIETADIDGDGDFDVIIHTPVFSNFNEVTGEVFISTHATLITENTGTASSPDLTNTYVNPFNIQLNALLQDVVPEDENLFNFMPIEFVDMDSDGDLDMVGAACSTPWYGYNDLNHRLFFVENTGSATEPFFESTDSSPFDANTNHSDLCNDISIVDIDGDGDLDLFKSVYSFDLYICSIYYIENEGTNNVPVFNEYVNSPFGIDGTLVEGIYFNSFCDIDDDGDYDLFINDLYAMFNDYSNSVYFQENIGSVNVSDFTSNYSNKRLIKIVDSLGREVESNQNEKIVFYVFDDGSVEKRFVLNNK